MKIVQRRWEMYKSGMHPKEIAAIDGVNPKTVGNQLRLAYGDEYMRIQAERGVVKVKEYNFKINPEMTPRQRQVAELYVEGLNQYEIAISIGVSPGRVHDILEAIEYRFPISPDGETEWEICPWNESPCKCEFDCMWED